MTNLPQSFEVPRGDLTLSGVTASLSRQWGLLIQTINAMTTIQLIDATSGSSTVTVNMATTKPNQLQIVKKIDASLNSVVIAPTSGSIDGASTKTLTTQYQVVRFMSDGTNLWTL